jgi:uncharacterized membrane protein
MGAGSFDWFDGLVIIPYIAVVILIVLLYRINKRVPKKDVRDAEGNVLASSKTSVLILKQRYAKGEISHEEYETMKKEITK